MKAERARFRVGIYADFQYAPPPVVRQALREEAAALLVPAGAVLDWRSSSRTERSEQWPAVATITFEGHCEDDGYATTTPHPWVFGRAYVVAGRIVPYGTIECDTIRTFLAGTLASMESQRRAAVYGRAVGRILAHELFHILTGAKRHSLGGIGKSGLTVAELIGDESEFHDPKIDQLGLIRAPAGKSVKASPGAHCSGSY